MYMAIASPHQNCKAVTNMTLNAFDFHHPGKHLSLDLHTTFVLTLGSQEGLFVQAILRRSQLFVLHMSSAFSASCCAAG